MAEKINLFELDIDTDAAVRDVMALKENIELLKSQTKKAKEEQGEFSAEYIKYSAALKSAQGEVRTQETLIKNATSANVAAAGSIDQIRKQLSVVSVQWAQLSKDQRENTEEGQRLTKQKKELTEALKGEEKATGDARRNVGNYSDAIGGLSPQYSAATGAAKKFKGGLDIISAHPIIAIMVALVAVVSALVGAFFSTEKGSDKLAKAWEQLGAVMDVLKGLVAGFGETIVAAFENPKKAVKDLWEFIKQNFINRFHGLVEFVKQSGVAIVQTLKGNFKEAKEAAAEAGKSFIEMQTGVKWEDMKNAVKGIKEELEGAAAAARVIAEMKVEIRKAQINLTNENAKYVKQIAKLRLEEADLNKTLEERLSAAKQANELEIKRNAAQLNFQGRIAELAKAELEATPENLRTDEQRLKVAEERAKLAEMEAQSLNFRRELTTKIAGFEIQIAKQKTDLALAAMDAELAIEEKRLAKEKEASDKRLSQADQDRADQLLAAQMDYENKLELARNNQFALLDLEREGLENQRLLELEFAEKIGADKSLINEKYAEYEKEIEREKTEAKLALQAGFAANLAQIFGQATAVGKAAAIAETTFNTFSAAQKAFTSFASIPVVGPVLGAAAAGAAIVSGIARVKKIAAVKSGLPGDKSGGGSISGGGTSGGGMPTSVAPSVGQGLASRASVSNQASTIKQGFSEALRENPIQPTLVLDTVTANQSAETQRNETSLL